METLRLYPYQMAQIATTSQKHLLTYLFSSRLERIKGGSGILISVVKTLDVLLGDELRTLCKTAEKALSDGSQIGDEVRAKHSLIAAVSLDRQAMSKVDSLLADVSHGRVTISTELEDHDDLYAATCT